tara:strand:- start:636 stop:1142 length:507 start_codon:yes stop_codon:yes gene_type:complete
MTTFPSLVPNAISLNHGLPQISEYEAFGIGPVRFRHNNYVNGQEFQLVYQALDQDSIELIRTHYRDNNGTSGQFDIPASVLALLNTTDSSSRYRYAETPTEEHIGLQRYNVTISVKAVEGLLLQFTLNGGPATLPAEEAFDEFVFTGTMPFILNGFTASQATLILNAS